MNSKRIWFVLFLALNFFCIALTCSYIAISNASNQGKPHPHLPLPYKGIWTEKEWNKAEYEADIIAHASYKTATFKQESQESFEEYGEYIAQAKAWHDIREMARQGTLGLITEAEFTIKRQTVYKEFGLKIPDPIYEHAVYQILLKWADWPIGYPSMIDGKKFIKLLDEHPEQVEKLKDELKQIAFPYKRKGAPQANTRSATNKKPKTESDILALLPHLNFDPEPAITDFCMWFGNERGGFASLLGHNLFKSTMDEWKSCWHPTWQLIGSCSNHTAISGSDLDIVVVLNPNSEDAVNVEWNEDGTLKKVLLNNQEVTTRRIIQLWDAFWKTCDQTQIQSQPGDEYPMISSGRLDFAPAWIQIRVEKAIVDLLPAFRTADGSYLYFSVQEESAKLFYSNSEKAGRFLEPFMQWDNFVEVIKLLKLLLHETWDDKLPKLSNSALEKIAFELAKEMGQQQWKNTSLVELLRAGVDRLIWHLDSNTPLYALNDVQDDLLAKFRKNDLTNKLRAIFQSMRSKSTAEICSILQSIIDHQLKPI